ncbi:MAG: ACT domain-containing protein [Nitrosopumilaceae archaeon]|nr:ACT domain-containing protein [Nitrosopumilaceae archaeon]
MRTVGISVPDAIREIITRNRSIYDCMRMDLINYTALAVRIQPEVERMLGGPVNLNTVVVAIKRYADRLSVREDAAKGEESVLKNARVVLTDGMMDIRFSAEEFDRLGGAPEMLAKFAKMGGNYEFFRLSDSFRFLAEDMEDVREMFRGMLGKESAAGGRGGCEEEERMFSTGLAKIRIVLPSAARAGSGPSDIVSHVAEILHAAGIEIVNAYFGQDGITVILREKDAARAYEVLRAGAARARI